MAPSTTIPEGYDLLPGHSGDKAREALALADERGFSAESVLRVRNGYLVPLGDSEAAEVEAEEVELPKATDSNEEIAAWRDEYLPGFEFPEDATNKEKKVAAIEAEVARRAAENTAPEED